MGYSKRSIVVIICIAMAVGMWFALLAGIQTSREANADSAGLTGGSYLWERLPGLGNDLNDVAAVDQDTVWAVGDGGAMYKSTDGGKHWDNQVSGNTQNFTGISAADKNTAWVARSEKTILATTDGGDTWDSQEVAESVFDVDAVNLNTVWAIGGKNIYRSTDGGNSFNDRSPILNTYAAIGALAAVDDQTAWAVENYAIGHGYGVSIYRTIDGGESWDIGHPLTSMLRPVSAQDIYAVDASTAWVVGEDFYWNEEDLTYRSVICKTIDGGANWTYQYPETDTRLLGISALDLTTAWAVGTSGTVLHTTDGGATWYSERGDCSSHLTAIHAIDAHTVWAVGEDGAVLHTVPPDSSCYLPEGVTTSGFETWVLVQNPKNYPVPVGLSFQTDQGEVTPPELQGTEIPALSRVSFNVGEYVSTYNVSTRVDAFGGSVICERATYWNGR